MKVQKRSDPIIARINGIAAALLLKHLCNTQARSDRKEQSSKRAHERERVRKKRRPSSVQKSPVTFLFGDDLCRH